MMKKQLLARVLLISVVLLVAALPGTWAADGKGGIDKSGAEDGETLAFQPSAPKPASKSFAVHTYTNTTVTSIPDNGCPALTNSVISVPDNYLVGSLTVGVCLAHTYRSDLQLYLLGPDGTQVTLILNVGSSADNLNVTFDDASVISPDSTNHSVATCDYPNVWRPSGSLASFFGKQVNGNWTLQICDDYSGDTGSLSQWTLTVNDLPPGVYISPATASGSACPGDQVPYSYVVSNFTGDTTAVNLAYASSWPVSGPAATSSLPQGGFETIDISVKVDGAAIPGSTSVCTITGSGGGYTGTATATTQAGMFSGWEDMADLTPTTHRTREHSVVYYNGKLYRIGGYDGTSAVAYLTIYDIATDTWSNGASMPAGRIGIDAVEIGGKIYVAGGGTSTTAATNTLYVYDIAGNSWTSATALPAARMSYAGVAYNGKYYVIGGYGAATYYSTIYVYDPVANSWSTALPNMTIPRRYASAGVMGGSIYVAGGTTTGAAFTLTTEVFNIGTGSWSTFAGIPATIPGTSTAITGWIRAADAVIQDRYMIMAGGYSGDLTASSYVWIYDSVANSWAMLTPMPHLIYSTEGDGDGTTMWLATGRQADPSFHYGEHTTRLVACPDPAPVLQYDHEITADSCETPSPGSGNGALDPGETADISVYLVNTGNAPATGVTAVLSTATAGITVTTDTASFGDISDFPTGAVTSAAPFLVAVDRSVACGTIVDFSLAVTTNEGSYTFTFSLLIGILGAPVNLVAESFDNATTVPPAIPTDWATTIVSNPGTSPVWSTVTAGIYPTQAPYSAPNEAMFNSWTCSSGAQMRLYRTEPVDLSSYASATLTFRMYHDTGYTNLDYIQPQVSLDGGTTWTPVGTPFYRYIGAGVIEWRQHAVDLTSYAGQPSVMIGFLGVSAYGNNMFMDDVSLDAQSVLCYFCCPLITLDPATLPDSEIGVAYNQTIVPTGGSSPYSFAVTAGALPAGMTLDGSTGVISGTSTAVETANFTIEVTDSYGCTGSLDYTVNVVCPVLALTPAALPDGNISVPYSQTLVPSGGTAPYTLDLTSGSLPFGLTFNAATGVISGSPTTAGLYTFDITVTDSNGCSTPVTFTINVTFGFDWTFYDDLSRSQVCINSTTGYYAWYVLTAPWTGTYVGKATITPTSWGYTVVEKDKPSGIRLYIYTVYNRASGSFQRPPMTTSSKLIDSDLTDDPACP